MEFFKTRKPLNYPLLLGIIDSVLLFLGLLVMNDEHYRKDDSFGSFMLFLVSIIAVNLVLSFFLKKSYGACITMIFWGLFRFHIPQALVGAFGIGNGDGWIRFQKLFRYFPVIDAWIPVLAGALGILTMLWAKKAVDFSQEEKEAFIAKRSVFVIVTAFYFVIFLLLLRNSTPTFELYREAYRGDYSPLLLDILSARPFGYSVPSICTLFQYLGYRFEFEILEKIFDFNYVSLWCYALLPSYLIYLGIHHPFSEKTSKPLCVIGTALTLITSIGVISQFSDKEDMTWNLLLVIISLVCVLGGYFYFCKKLPEWSYALVGCGFLIYAPIILLAILLAICYFIFKAIFKDRPSSAQSSQPKKWEVVENGITYIIEERGEGKFVDNQNGYWDTNDNGQTFYRKE